MFNQIIRASRHLRVFQSRISTKTAFFSSSTLPEANPVGKRIPITVLSGFLGAGKTTFLQHALSNETGTKYGLLVNDMGSVNVDSKLVQKTTTGQQGVETLQLSNGCVCCSLAEDLLMSVAQLLHLAESKNSSYDHVIVECSGIAEPRKIIHLFQEATENKYEIMEKVYMDTLVTVVDCTVFLKLFGTDQDMRANQSLAIPADGSGAPPMDDTTGIRRVTDLLLEQVECADIVLINKIDLIAKPEYIDLVTKVIKSTNPTAKVIRTERGAVDPIEVVGSGKGHGAVLRGILEQHRTLIDAVETGKNMGVAHGEEGHVCDSACDDHETVAAHDHNHSHDHAHDTACAHDHGQCDDPTHDHSHTHDHVHSEETTAQTRFGITSFVYKRRRPFHPARYTTFLQRLGKVSVQGLSDVTADSVSTADVRKAKDSSGDEELVKAKKNLLRSKGFVWMATSAAGAYYMSHAGQYLELVVLGRWWAAMNQEDWPEEAVADILRDFDQTGSHGDRRQEVVLIGQFEDANSRQALETALDSCLLSDEEMKQYEETAPNGDKALRELFLKND